MLGLFAWGIIIVDDVRPVVVSVGFGGGGGSSYIGNTVVIKKTNYGFNFWNRDKELSLALDDDGSLATFPAVPPGDYIFFVERNGWRCQAGGGSVRGHIFAGNHGGSFWYRSLPCPDAGAQ